MDEILRQLAERTGLDPATAKNGLGAVIAYLKSHLPEGLFSQVEGAMPGAQGLADTFESEKSSSGGGLLGTVAGMVGKLVGGGGADASKLLAMLGQAGLSVGQIQTFLPRVLELLQAHLPPDLIEKIKGLLPTAPAAEPPAQA